MVYSEQALCLNILIKKIHIEFIQDTIKRYNMLNFYDSRFKTVQSIVLSDTQAAKAK
jgi:hypothetical protein